MGGANVRMKNINFCKDAFRTVNRRVEELVSQVAGLRFYR
jgi:hypothetical protein